MKTEKELRKILDQMRLVAAQPCNCQNLIERLNCQSRSSDRQLLIDCIACVLEEPSVMEGQLKDLAFIAEKIKETLTQQKTRLDS